MDICLLRFITFICTLHAKETRIFSDFVHENVSEFSVPIFATKNWEWLYRRRKFTRCWQTTSLLLLFSHSRPLSQSSSRLHFKITEKKVSSLSSLNGWESKCNHYKSLLRECYFHERERGTPDGMKVTESSGMKGWRRLFFPSPYFALDHKKVVLPAPLSLSFDWPQGSRSV